MSKRKNRTKGVRARACAVACLMLAACAGFYVYARTRTRPAAPFALAEDCPRGALVYAQFADLPALLKLWDESQLKARYLDSTNFKQFRERHLALKLLERWQEFDDALGFPLDLSSVGSAAETSAALALYDVGRLEFVFVAPLSAEKMAAVRFVEGADEFEATELADGTTYYSRDVEADRGRQKQKILFASARGRFVLATSEQLLLRTLANVNGRARRDRLADDPAFKTLSDETRPHFATVWVDQSKLNDDWYFKHYWAMRNPRELQHIRAGIFDLEIRDARWIEQRSFLTAPAASDARPTLPAADLRRAAALLPPDAVQTHLRALGGDGAEAAASVLDSLLDRLPPDDEEEGRHASHSYDYFRDDFGGGYRDGDSYRYLDSDFDQTIDETSDDDDAAQDSAQTATEAPQPDDALRQLLQAARPSWAATAEGAQSFKGPLFVEFRRATVVSLAQPDALRREQFEQALAALVRRRLMVGGAQAGLEWVTREEGGARWRELPAPMLGWRLCYALSGRELVVANSAEFLRAMLGGQAVPGGDGRDAATTTYASDFAADDLNVVRFARRREAFDAVVNKLDAPRVEAYWKQRSRGSSSDEAEGDAEPEHTSQEFFSGNVLSLLDVASGVERVEIRRRTTPQRLRERVEIVLHAPAGN